jgi:hypothetical protein
MIFKFTVMNWLQKHLQKLILLAGSREYKTWYAVTLSGRKLSSFSLWPLMFSDASLLYKPSQHFLSCAFGPSPCFVRFLFGRHTASTEVFLSRNESVNLTLLIRSWIFFVLGMVIVLNLIHFLRHFLAGPHLTHSSYKKVRCSTLYRNISRNTHIHTQ